ncbi:hypothetical protein D3C73_1366000 [compost metagenome]
MRGPDALVFQQHRHFLGRTRHVQLLRHGLFATGGISQEGLSIFAERGAGLIQCPMPIAVELRIQAVQRRRQLTDPVDPIVLVALLRVQGKKQLAVAQVGQAFA